MRFKKLGRAAALLLVLGLLGAAGPMEASPERVAEPAVASSLVKALSDWITALLAGPGSVEAPVSAPAWAVHGTVIATEGGPQSPAHAADDPTAEPQLGGDIDPNG